MREVICSGAWLGVFSSTIQPFIYLFHEFKIHVRDMRWREDTAQRASRECFLLQWSTSGTLSTQQRCFVLNSGAGCTCGTPALVGWSGVRSTKRMQCSQATSAAVAVSTALCSGGYVVHLYKCVKERAKGGGVDVCFLVRKKAVQGFSAACCLFRTHKTQAGHFTILTELEFFRRRDGNRV